MGATLITLLTTIKAQLDALLAKSITPADAATIQTAAQGISDTLTNAGSPPTP